MRMEISHNEKIMWRWSWRPHIEPKMCPHCLLCAPPWPPESKWTGWAPADTFWLQLCELKINQFPANKALVPYHLSAAGWEINEGGTGTRVAPLANKYRFMGLPASHWSKPLKLNCPTSLTAAAGSHLQYCSVVFIEVHFQVLGLWPCSLTTQNKWAKVSSVFLWVSTCLQDNAAGHYTPANF